MNNLNKVYLNNFANDEILRLVDHNEKEVIKQYASYENVEHVGSIYMHRHQLEIVFYDVDYEMVENTFIDKAELIEFLGG